MEYAAPQTNLYFDHDISLDELLKVVELDRLRVVLESMLGPELRLVTPDGAVMLGASEPDPDAGCAAFKLELEPIGYIELTRHEGLPAAVVLMEILMQSAARYFMAAAVQMESVQQDYAELQERNNQIQASEERYRQLAGDLEQRVSDQVRTIEATQRQLYQAEKLVSVGQLAAGIAHEINNPIGFIKSNLNTADGYLERFRRLGALLRDGQDLAQLRAAWQQEGLDQALDDFSALLTESNDGVMRVANIVSALRDFSSIDRAAETFVDINTLIENTCHVASGELGARIELTTDFGVLPVLRCHSARLGQVFLSLLLNAVQAIPEHGVISIATSSEACEIRVRISDTGKGIPDDVQARMFEPFYTTRGVGQGTGLGLTMARDVVQVLGGRIEVQSQVGVGTTFTVILPTSAEAASL